MHELNNDVSCTAEMAKFLLCKDKSPVVSNETSVHAYVRHWAQPGLAASWCHGNLADYTPLQGSSNAKVSLNISAIFETWTYLKL